MSAVNPLLPPIVPEAAPFWEGALAGALRLQRCADSGRLLFPPRSLSPWGEHRPPEWVTLSGRGSVWSFVRPHPPLLPYFAGRAPYTVVLVALEEDERVRLVGGFEGEPAIGLAVRVAFAPSENGIALPRWLPA